jgi:elongation factor 3
MPTAMSAPAAPQISKEDIKLDHGAVPAHSDAKADVATILSSSSDRASRVDAAKELVDLVKLEGPHAFVRLGLSDAVLKGLADKKNAGEFECFSLESYPSVALNADCYLSEFVF